MTDFFTKERIEHIINDHETNDYHVILASQHVYGMLKLLPQQLNTIINNSKAKRAHDLLKIYNREGYIELTSDQLNILNSYED